MSSVISSVRTRSAGREWGSASLLFGRRLAAPPCIWSALKGCLTNIPRAWAMRGREGGTYLSNGTLALGGHRSTPIPLRRKQPAPAAANSVIPPRVRADPLAARRSQALRASPQCVRPKARWYQIFTTAPSGPRPTVTQRPKATISLRAIATSRIRRIRPLLEPPVHGTSVSGRCPVDGAATAKPARKPARSRSASPAGCPTWPCPGRA